MAVLPCLCGLFHKFLCKVYTKTVICNMVTVVQLLDNGFYATNWYSGLAWGPTMEGVASNLNDCQVVGLQHLGQVQVGEG